MKATLSVKIAPRSMHVAVFGLGYVGTVTAACLARSGHRVIGTDINSAKVRMLRHGQSPVVEPGLSELVREVRSAGRLQATGRHTEAVLASEASLVCVGTPSDHNGGLDLRYVRQVAGHIGDALRHKKDYHVVVLRSTVLPATAENEVLPVLEAASGKRAGKDFGLCVNPEFLREGTSIGDFSCPPLTLIGELDERSGDVLATLYSDIEAPLVRTELKTAEMIKYVSNAWHALKITFANEIGNFCKRSGIDSHRVIDVFALDTKLNISPAYMRPGFAFGGSCLPKDLRALLHRAQSEHLDLPVLEAVLRSNELQARIGLDMILGNGKKRIGVLGCSFKEHSDDLRESPMVQLIEALIGKGYHVRVYDADVLPDRLMGANRRYIEQTIPHIASLMCDDIREVVDHAQVLVVGKSTHQIRELVATLNSDRIVVDLVRVFGDPSRLDGKYAGICW